MDDKFRGQRTAKHLT